MHVYAQLSMITDGSVARANAEIGGHALTSMSAHFCCLSASSAPRRPHAARAEAAAPLLASDGLPVREHLAETPGADVKNEPPDRDVLRDPWM